MTYSINGIPLDNPSLGWRVVRGSTPVMGFTYSIPSSEIQGRDGHIPLPSTRGATSLQLLIQWRNDTRAALLNLMSAPEIKLTDSNRPGWTAFARLETTSPEKYYGHKDWGVDLFVLEVPGGAWRGVETTTPLIGPLVGGNALELHDGLTAPIMDGVVRFKGPLTNPQLTDSRGSYAAVLGDVGDVEYIRLDMRTSRAWATTTDTWTGGVEVSALLDFGGPRGHFEITPTLKNPTDPLHTVGRVTLTQSAYGSDSGVQIRSRSAQLF